MFKMRFPMGDGAIKYRAQKLIFPNLLVKSSNQLIHIFLILQIFSFHSKDKVTITLNFKTLSIKLYFSLMKVVILGYGNVAAHLLGAFQNSKKTEVIQIYNRSKLTGNQLPEVTTQLSEIKEADVYLIAIPDDSIANFSEKLPFTNRLVVHTSGSVAMTKLSEKNSKGIFYPLQTFTKDRVVDFKTIPICVEAEKESDLRLLHELGSCISEKIVEINSEERRRLHLGAVFVNNFTNHMYQISEEILAAKDLDFELLKPLLLETAHKMEAMSPLESQTGPARRDDQKTIEDHLHLLQDQHHKEIYKTITKSIQKTHGKKL